MIWQTVTLGEVATIERDSVDPNNILSGTEFLGLENIQSGGEILGSQCVSNGEIASTKFRFNSSHVLYGKLRPYLAKIALPDFEGVCSTDILPIAPGPNLDRKFLAYYLRQPSMVDLANSRSAGANLPRLSPKVLAEFKIPLPLLEEQRRIAAILDKADGVRRKRKEAIALTEDLLRSTFLEMFREYFNQNYTKRFSEVSEVLVDCRNKTAPYASTGIPLIRTTNFRNCQLDLTELKYVTTETNKIWSARHQTAPGDVVFCREAPFGMAAIVPDDFYPCLGQRIMISRPDESLVLREYLLFALNSSFVYKQAQSVAVGSAVKHLRVADVEKLEIPVPPLRLQNQFVALHRITTKIVSRNNSQEILSGNLFNSLLQRAFRGEL